MLLEDARNKGRWGDQEMEGEVISPLISPATLPPYEPQADLSDMAVDGDDEDSEDESGVGPRRTWQSLSVQELHMIALQKKVALRCPAGWRELIGGQRQPHLIPDRHPDYRSMSAMRILWIWAHSHVTAQAATPFASFCRNQHFCFMKEYRARGPGIPVWSVSKAIRLLLAMFLGWLHGPL